MKFLVDFDSTIFDLTTAQLRHLNEKFGTELSTDHITDWYWENTGHFTPAMVEYVWGPEVWLNEEFHVNGEFVHGAAEGLQRLIDYGYDPHIVTDRPMALANATVNWLRTNGFGNLPVILTNRDGYPKRQAMEDYSLTHVIEDAPHAVAALIDRAERFYLIDRPYNQTVSHPDVIRVYGWRDLTRRIKPATIS